MDLIYLDKGFIGILEVTYEPHMICKNELTVVAFAFTIVVKLLVTHAILHLDPAC